MAATRDGLALYAGALPEADIVHRVVAEGTEDYVAFEQRPEREEIAYDVDVSRAAGLRLVGRTLEFLDAAGAPRVRVAPPYVVDARGERYDGKVDIEGCAVDVSPAAPWGRAVTAPGASHCAVRVTWEATTYPVIVDPSWVVTGSMSAERTAHTGTLLGSGRVLVAGGCSSNNGSCTSLASADLYDEATGTFAATGNMTTTRSGHVANLLGSGKVLLAGGYSTVYLASAELYDPAAGTFAATGSLTTARIYPTSALLGSGKVLVMGGAGLASADLYDPAAGTFAATGSMTAARSGNTATVLGSGKVLVAGGSNNTSWLASAELYDPAAGSFAATGSMSTIRAGHTATLLASGKVLVAGGDNTGVLLASAELYDPAAGAFSPTGSMAGVRSNHTATLLESGKVLVAGGYGNTPTGYLSSAELYDLVTGTFAATASLPIECANHVDVRLGSGNVLIAGGVNFTSNYFLSSAEVYQLVAAGAACTLSDDCVSGVCEDATCCSGACSGTCMTCTAGTGACVPVTNADDPDTCTGTMTCDATGTCKLKTGQPCPGGGSTCATGFCFGSFCCTQSCGGACESCAQATGASANGTCTILPMGNPGNPPCGNGLACDGTSSTCPGASCAGDLDCVPSDYCNANGMCVPRKAQGAACNQAVGADCKVAGCHDCTSGYCVDGVCCNTACNTLCVACTAALQQPVAEGGAPQDGVCGHARDNTNPHNDSCPASPPSTCGPDGECNGAGGCRLYYPPGTACGASMCISGNKAAGDLCNGSGTCAPDPNGVSCGNYQCKSGSCPTSCAMDTDCVATAYCKQGACVPRAGGGTACTSPDQCTSNLCVDGYCCNAACTGQCEACDVANTQGTCTPVVGSPHGSRPACQGGEAGACSAALCDGITAGSCTGYVGPSVACRAPSCTNGVQTLPASCDGMGNCPAPVTKQCAPYVCDTATNACKTACATATDCTQGGTCVQGQCVTGSTCDPDGHTVVDPAGNRKDCTPYACSGGACVTSCASVNDCVTPYVCSPAKQCVAAPTAPSGSSSGCATGPSRGASSPPSWLALGMLGTALGLLRRSRRRTRSRRGPAAA